jgi:hypothetical protein
MMHQLDSVLQRFDNESDLKLQIMDLGTTVASLTDELRCKTDVPAV